MISFMSSLKIPFLPWDHENKVLGYFAYILWFAFHF